MTLAHFTSRRIVGYTVPVVTLVVVLLLHDPNSSRDARPLLWLFPMSCLIGAYALLAELVRKDLRASWPSIIIGFLAVVLAICSSGFLIAFNGWLHVP